MFYSFRHVLKIVVRVGAILVAMIIATASQAIDYFVDQNKSSGTSGLGQPDWSDAFITLEEALGIAVDGDTIFVAEGTYTPNDASGSGAQTQTYLIDRTLIILGGYKGEDEVVSMQRDPMAFLTILSGDFKNPPDDPFIGDLDYLRSAKLVDNTHTVVTVSNVTDGTRIEGFIIERAAGGVRGGGMFIDDSQMDVVNCTFRYNVTGIPFEIPEGPGTDPGQTSDGGGATVRGGQIVASVTQYTRFINCTFHDNIAARGGGLALVDESNTPTQVKVINSLFYNNKALEITKQPLIPPDGSGGAILVYGVDDVTICFDVMVEVTNCTIVNNCAQNTTGGLRVVDIEPAYETLVQNSVFWGNDEKGAPTTGAEITRHGVNPDQPSKISVRYSDVEGGLSPAMHWTLEEVIALDPLFVDEPNKDFRVSATSPVLDAAHPDTSITPLIPDDIYDLDDNNITEELTPEQDLRRRDIDIDNDGDPSVVDMGA